MAKVLFLQNYWYESPAVMSLSASLKQMGHQTAVAIGDSLADFSDILEKESFDIIGFSIMSGFHLWANQMSHQIHDMGLAKRPLIIFGGPHPTFYPDVLSKSAADAICVGEGDDAIVELAEALDRKSFSGSINNLSVKINGTIKTNPLRPLADVNRLPQMDRGIYYSYDYFRNYPTKSFMCGRGCPFQCTFCCNPALQKLYKGKGAYVRFRNPEDIVSEVEEVSRTWKCRTAYFIDDTFGLNKSWTMKLLDLYKRTTRMPFICKIRADTVDEEMISAFRQANCCLVQFGIESSNEKTRTELLKKQIRDEDIFRTAALLNKHKIKFLTYNMVGIPDETLDDVMKAMSLNAKIGTSFPWCSIFNPYPGTALADYCIKRGYIDRDFNPDQLETSFHKASVMKGRNYRQVSNIHKLFGLGVFMPFLIPLIRRISIVRPNVFFTWVFLFVSFHNYLKGEQLKWHEALLLGLRNVKHNLSYGKKRNKQAL